MADTQTNVYGYMSQTEVEAIDPDRLTTAVGDIVNAACPDGHVFSFVLKSLTLNVGICPECGMNVAFEFNREQDVFFTPNDSYPAPFDGPTVVIHFERLPDETWVRVHGRDECWRIPANELMTLVAKARPNLKASED